MPAWHLPPKNLGQVDGHLAHLSGGSASSASSAGQESQKVWLEFVQQIATLYHYIKI